MTQLEFNTTGRGASQCDRILSALTRQAGQWVAMTDLWHASGAFAVHSRIADLRKRGNTIEHRNETQPDRTIHSFYRLNA
jgi:hypothetical protein